MQIGEHLQLVCWYDDISHKCTTKTINKFPTDLHKFKLHTQLIM